MVGFAPMTASSLVPEIAPGVRVAGRYTTKDPIAAGTRYRLLCADHGEEEIAILFAPLALAPAFARPEARDRLASAGVLDLGVDEGTRLPFVALPAVDGRPLRDVMPQMSRPASLVLAGIEPIARALAAASSRGLVHGALSPRHVVVSSGGTPSIWGIGVSHWLAHLEGLHGPMPVEVDEWEWLAPELVRGVAPSSASDVWALALLAAELLYGRPWHEGDESIPQRLMRVVLEELPSPSVHYGGPPPLAPEIGPAFDAWFARCTRREPGQRIGDASVALEELRAALSGEQPSLPPPVDPYPILANPKGSWYDDGLKPVEPPIVLGNPKGSFYDGGLPPRRIWPWIVLALVLGAIGAAIGFALGMP